MLRKFNFRIQRFWLKLLFKSLNIILKSGFTDFNREQVKDFRTSGIFGFTEGFNFSQLYHNWQKGMKLAAEGHYFKSNKIFEQCLYEVYKINNIDPNSHVPKFLSYGFSHSIGHRALIGLILAAQDAQLIPTKKRILPTRFGNDLEQIEILYGSNQNLEIIKLQFGYRFFEPPTFWHQSERVMMINGGKKFLPTPEFIEKTYSKINLSGKYMGILFGESYIMAAEKELLKLGLPTEVQFVVLHVRKKTYLDDTRQANIMNYKLAVQDLISRGIWVVQLGTDDQITLIEHNKYIVVQGPNSNASFLTPYLLSKCKFFINTCSGPTYLAPLFGTPVLQTNVIAIGKNSTTLSKNSMHLPKNWEYLGRKLGLSKLLQSPEGYSDPGINYLKKRNFTLIENSSEEILLATQDMEYNLNNKILDIKMDPRLTQIRETYNAPAKGLIAPSYIDANKKWFLE